MWLTIKLIKSLKLGQLQIVQLVIPGCKGTMIKIGYSKLSKNTWHLQPNPIT